MAISRVIEVSFGRSSVALVRIDTAYFYNNGIIFKPTDIDLPASYQVHWADSPDKATTLETIGTAEGAPIPDDLWNRSRVIYGWIYLHPTEDSGITAYEVRIYKNVRAGLPDGTEPTPAEQSTIDQLISALNGAVEQAEDAQEAIENMSVSAQTLAQGADATVTKTEVGGVVNLHFGLPLAAGAGGEVTEEEFNQLKEESLHNLTTTQSTAHNTYNSLLTNLPGNTSVWTKGSWWNDAPDIGSYFYVYSFGVGGAMTMTNIGTQIAINPSTLKVATRRIQSGAWTNWVDNVVRDGPVLYCFGDSLTQGAVWDSNQDTAYFIAPENDQIPTRIANAIGSKTFYNMGSSGARYVRQSDDSASKKTIVELIKEADLSTATIVVIGGGRNDSATALGTGATATANDGTICGAIVDALEYLTTTYPKLQIVVFGVTPQPTSTSHAPSDIFTRVFSGGWSLNTFYSEAADVCEKYGVPFIDWYGCTLMYRWGVLSGGYSSGTQNWSHPLSSDIYRQMGNYLGGRIASTTPSLTNYVQFTDLATTSKAGAMSAQDKGRLDTVYADYSSALTALGVI